MASPNTLFTDLTVATIRDRRKEIADNMSQHNALYNRLRKNGNVRTLNGGTTIVENLSYQENQTYQRYSGYDALNISPSSVFTAAEYLWCQAMESITFSGREERINKGDKTRVFELVKERVDNAFASAANVMNRDMYSAGTLPNQIGGLQLIVADNPQNMVGGISGATWNFWRNKVLDLGTETGGPVTLTPDNILHYMNRMYVMCTRGTDVPDFILMSPDWFNIYESSQQQIQRYTASAEANSGFVTLKYKGKDVFFDQTIGPDGETPIMPDNHMYFINTKYIKLREHVDARWTQAEDKISVNQDATIIPLLWMGNLTCSNRFLQGVMIKTA